MGNFSAIASHYVGSYGAVYAIEANPQTFIYLTKMLRESGVTNVIALNYAVCNENGQILSFNKPLLASDAFGHISNKPRNYREQKVTSITIDAIWKLVGKPSLRMVKIDVEGMEPKVLVGAKECLSTGVSDCVLIEINKWTAERCGESYKSCYKQLIDFGFVHIYKPNIDVYEKVDIEDKNLPYDATMLFSRLPLQAR